MTIKPAQSIIRRAAACCGVRRTLLAVGLVAAAFAAGCESRSSPPGAWTLLASGDTAGWIVPCGCASGQAGGLLRRGGFVEQVREQRPLLLVDCGGAPAGTAPYQRAKFQAILDGELAMGLVAHNLGAGEIALGPDYLRSLVREHKVPFVSANARDAKGKLLVEPSRTITLANSTRVRVIGVASPQYATDAVRIDDPREAVLSLLADDSQSVHAIVLLAYLPDEALRSLAAQLPEIDVVVGGPTGQPIPPTRLGPTQLVSATNKGKFLARLDYEPTAGPGERWRGEVVEVDETWPDHPRQSENLRAFYARLEQEEFPATATGFAPAHFSGDPEAQRVAGTQSCRACHEQDCTTWEDSGHAHAWQTLANGGAHVDAYCQQCHSTGYGLAGGFDSRTRTPDLVNVGCESCHGPSAGHVLDPRSRTPLVARDQCITCHDRENSPQFSYAEYWPQIEHGEPAARRTSDGPTLSKNAEVSP